MDREAGHEHFEYFPPFNLEPGLCLRVRTKFSCASGDSPVVPSSYRINQGLVISRHFRRLVENMSIDIQEVNTIVRLNGKYSV